LLDAVSCQLASHTNAVTLADRGYCPVNSGFESFTQTGSLSVPTQIFIIVGAYVPSHSVWAVENVPPHIKHKHRKKTKNKKKKKKKETLHIKKRKKKNKKKKKKTKIPQKDEQNNK